MPDVLRVLHLRASNFVGGPERQIVSYCGLPSKQVQQSIATFVGSDEGSAFLEFARCNHIESIGLPSSSLDALSRLIRHVREKQVDVICSHGYKADILGLLAARRTGAKAVPFLRGWTGEDTKVSFFENLDRYSLRFAHRVVCLSLTQAETLVTQGIASDRIRVVRNTSFAGASENSRIAARETLATRYGIADADAVIASAGRLSPEKGTRYFLKAAEQIDKCIPSVRFLVFGDGVLRDELQKLATLSPIASRITFAGLIPDFPALLPGIDLLVNPSLSEQVPNVVLEAMAARVPCVVTAVGALPEISGERGALLLVPPANPEAIATGVTLLLTDRLRAQKQAAVAYERVHCEYGCERQHEDLQTLFDELRSGEIGTSGVMQEALPAIADPPFISVVMPVRNEEACIASLLDDLLRQDYDASRFEILVCDGMSDDGTPRIVSEYERKLPGQVRLINNPGRLSSAGRNCGVRASRGDVIVFVDGHCSIATDSMLSNIAGIFQTTIADVISRPQPLHANIACDVQIAISAARSSLIGHGRDSTIYSLSQHSYVAPDSSGAIYRREVFDRVGLYDESFDACEDVELNVRCRKAGMLAYTSPGVMLEYEPRRTLGGLWKQMVRYGKGRTRLYQKHPDSFSVAAMAPALFIVLLAASLAFSPFSSYSAGFAAVLITTYLAAITVGAAPAVVKHGPKIGFLTAVSFVLVHFGLGYGFLREAVAWRKPTAPARYTSTTS
jgi:glycosyltransferase involved in cell wall biosynthesis/GT2 family glycosyltransferase